MVRSQSEWQSIKIQSMGTLLDFSVLIIPQTIWSQRNAVSHQLRHLLTRPSEVELPFSEEAQPCIMQTDDDNGQRKFSLQPFFSSQLFSIIVIFLAMCMFSPIKTACYIQLRITTFLKGDFTPMTLLG